MSVLGKETRQISKSNKAFNNWQLAENSLVLIAQRIAYLQQEKDKLQSSGGSDKEIKAIDKEISSLLKKQSNAEKDKSKIEKDAVNVNKYGTSLNSQISSYKLTNDSAPNKRDMSDVTVGTGSIDYNMPDTVVKPSISDVKQKVDNTITKEDKSLPNEEVEVLSRGIIDNYNTDTARRDMDPYYMNDNAKNNIRGNLNNLKYDDTLKMSRAVDYLNNKLYRPYGTIGRATNSSFGNVANSVVEKQPYKMQEANTQETRQMRNDEQLDVLTRQGDINLANKVRTNAYDLTTKAQDLRLDLARQTGLSDVQLNNYIRQAAVDGEYKQQLQTWLMQINNKFITDLQLATRNSVLNKVLSKYVNNPTIASLSLNTLLGVSGTPDAKEYLYSALVGDILSSDLNVSNMDKLKAIQAVNSFIGRNQTASNIAAFTGR